MPTVTILSPTKVSPDPVRLMRNDQTILWQLAPGLEWGSIQPIQYLPGDPNGTPPTKDWPATASHPRPVNPADPPATRRYWASANFPIPSDQSERYHYEILIQELTPDGVILYKVHLQREDGEWYDPDVLNEPQP